jgi:hypothetical protein
MISLSHSRYHFPPLKIFLEFTEFYFRLWNEVASTRFWHSAHQFNGARVFGMQTGLWARFCTPSPHRHTPKVPTDNIMGGRVEKEDSKRQGGGLGKWAVFVICVTHWQRQHDTQWSGPWDDDCPQDGTPASNTATWCSRRWRHPQYGTLASNAMPWPLRQWSWAEDSTPASNTATWCLRRRRRPQYNTPPCIQRSGAWAMAAPSMPHPHLACHGPALKMTASPASNTATWGSRQRWRPQYNTPTLHLVTWCSRQRQHPQYGTPALNATAWALRQWSWAENSTYTSNTATWCLRWRQCPQCSTLHHKSSNLGLWEYSRGFETKTLPSRQHLCLGNNSVALKTKVGALRQWRRSLDGILALNAITWLSRQWCRLRDSTLAIKAMPSSLRLWWGLQDNNAAF